MISIWAKKCRGALHTGQFPSPFIALHSNATESGMETGHIPELILITPLTPTQTYKTVGGVLALTAYNAALPSFRAKPTAVPSPPYVQAHWGGDKHARHRNSSTLGVKVRRFAQTARSSDLPLRTSAALALDAYQAGAQALHSSSGRSCARGYGPNERKV